MKKSAASPAPIPARIWKIAAIAGAGAFMAMLDSTVANLALESIRADLASPLATVQWVVTGYLIALAVSLPAAAWLGSRFGYGRVWGWSLAGFVGGSVLCALAPEPGTLIAARFLQGLAAGIMVPAGQAVIGATAERNQLGRLMGTLGLVIALGPALGPGLGGVLLEVASWRWLFWLNVPVGLLALLAGRHLIPPGERDPHRTLDWPGLALLVLGLPAALYGATMIGAEEINATAVSALAIGLTLILVFVLTATRKQRPPILDLRLLAIRRFRAATATCGLTGANMYAGLLLLPLYFQTSAGLGATATGLLLLALGLGSALVLPLAGALTDRHGPGRVSLAGVTLLVVTTLPFLLTETIPLSALVALLVLRGAGLALAQMPAMTAAYTAVSARQMGDATTLVNIVQRIGGALGAITVVVMLTQTGDGYWWAFAGLLVIALLNVVSAVGLTSRHEAMIHA
ncbi:MULTISPECIES: DHA2 family efflux MFS transporter permease subunit [Gammaproteobacteria]|jgi:EmrB/QacA subfamily drug resistance transporter|uniref:DHA2 family efflux MFS transporter permease subunit n=4 Tax=Pseudomonadota TaxID=1224 RepID=UPI00329966AC